MFGQIHAYLTLSRIANMSMRGGAKTAQHIAAQASAAGDSSSAASSSLPEAPIASGAYPIPPRAHDDSEVEVICSGESDLADSVKASEVPGSPPVSHPDYPSNTLLNERTRDLRHSLFSSEEEDDDG